MQQQEVKNLLKKYIAGECSEDEIALLETWYLQYHHEQLPSITALELRRQRAAVWEKLPKQQKPRFGRPVMIKVAAAIALLITAIVGLYLYTPYATTEQIAETKPTANQQIKPGGNRATLMLADGSVIALNEATKGELHKQAGVKIAKTADGQLRYSLTEDKAAPNNNQFNWIRTPKGGQYQVTLADGTKVWLNALSSIKIPLSFTAHERQVAITGEAYFEVAEDKNRPFQVLVNGLTINVLGTSFNIMAYPDEGKTKATLASGSIKLGYKNREVLLKPGEQGIINPVSNSLDVVKVETSNVLAWKDGLFVFDDTDLHTLMRQLSRWYNVEVIYEAGVKNEAFRGKIERSADFSDVLKILRLGDVNFRIEGKQLIVMP
ncbi:DUF4974 domain-containing protein [Olivibacter ginsenosidimutans]|uniref:DUF4974 domain-containing protein n=1 Tax=Olivibacter ginsenosidimutans TaxID=1176537 RepID=A0ABP9BYA6_9SPHI